MSEKKQGRRQFIITAGILGAAALTWTLFKKFGSKSLALVKGKMINSGADKGHLLRTDFTRHSDETIETETLIVGAGISALSAARYFSRNGHNNYVVIEMSDEVGGNSIGGKNSISAYPWAAHYLPLPNANQPEMLQFLEECKVIKGYENNLPVYNEYHLCFEQEEQIFMHGTWHKGLIPESILKPNEKKEIRAFMNAMNKFKMAIGTDGKEAFCIPVEQSSKDKQYTDLDAITMKHWLEQQGWKSEYLNWYVNYCCLDDFGIPADKASAWAGIHYFASRKGKAANAESHQMLTWPEGNYFLVKHLKAACIGKIRKNAMAFSVKAIETGYETLVLDTLTDKTTLYRSKQVLMSTPQFIASKILKGNLKMKDEFYQSFNYYPWLVANLTVKTNAFLNELAWDNVFYGSQSLGYVNARHQETTYKCTNTVITYYLPLQGESGKAARKKAYELNHETCVELVLSELEKAHKDIRSLIQEIDVKIWGHGMIAPVPGFISSDPTKHLNESTPESIQFAHTDLSGISIFEEAYYRGIKAAQSLMNNRHS